MQWCLLKQVLLKCKIKHHHKCPLKHKVYKKTQQISITPPLSIILSIACCWAKQIFVNTIDIIKSILRMNVKAYVIIFSMRLLLLTVCRLAKVTIFTINIDVQNQCLIYHKCACLALCCKLC